MGCDKEMTVIGAGREATMPIVRTRYCILKKEHKGKCMWSEILPWSYNGKFVMEVN